MKQIYKVQISPLEELNFIVIYLILAIYKAIRLIFTLFSFWLLGMTARIVLINIYNRSLNLAFLKQKYII